MTLAVALLVAACSSDRGGVTEPADPATEQTVPTGSGIADGGTQQDSLRAGRLGMGETTDLAMMSPLLLQSSCTTSHSTAGITGGCDSIVVYPATPRLRHSGGIYETAQTAPIDILFRRPISTFTISGNGAIKCSGNYGRVVGRAGSTQVGEADLVLIAPGDCDADSVTFGAHVTIQFTKPVDRVTIHGPQPWQFLVFGSTGRALANYAIGFTEADVYDVRPVYIGGSVISAPMQQVVDRAIQKWQAVIQRGAVPSLNVSLAADECYSGTPAFSGTVRGLRVYIEMVPGAPNSALGMAAPCELRGAGAGYLPAVAYVRIRADLEALASHSDPDSVMYVQTAVEHELGHALGIGTLWRSLGLMQGADTTTSPPDTLDPWFAGSNARASFIGLAPGYNGNYVPIELRPGHWRESVMGGELMTPRAGGSMALSVITIASLADLGYSVNMGAADPYTVGPSGNLKWKVSETSSGGHFGDCVAPETLARIERIVSSGGGG